MESRGKAVSLQCLVRTDAVVTRSVVVLL